MDLKEEYSTSDDDDDDDNDVDVDVNENDIENEKFASLADEDIERSIKPNFYQRWREIRKSDQDVLNRMRSVYVDYAFVQQTVEKLRGSGRSVLFANLRCGAWYTDLRDAKTCTFKSIDGHNLNHQFSQSRLNSHVLFEACRGGTSSVTVIVDATKSKTKRFPDALAKTVPIWCATINRACNVIARNARIEEDEFPDFVSENELHAIETKMPSFVETFLNVVPNFAEIKEALEKSGPLHCEYVCRNNVDDIVARKGEKKATVLYLLSASMPLSKSGDRCKLELGSKTVTYNYFPGAADDEESWALDLTAMQFQRHMEKFVSCESAKACENLIRKVIQTDGDDDNDEDGSEGTFISLRDVLDANIYVGTFQSLPMREEDVHAILYVGTKQTPNFSVKREDAKAYLHVPLKFAKQKRGDIEEKLPQCVEFLMKHATSKGRKTGVFVCCDDAKDLSIAVVTAFQLVKNKVHLCLPKDFTKETVRKVLADIATQYPTANPCQGTVKQVFAYVLKLIKTNNEKRA